MHPDSSSDKGKINEEAFKRITDAYDILSCKDKRARYDSYWNNRNFNSNRRPRQNSNGFYKYTNARPNSNYRSRSYDSYDYRNNQNNSEFSFIYGDIIFKTWLFSAIILLISKFGENSKGHDTLKSTGMIPFTEISGNLNDNYPYSASVTPTGGFSQQYIDQVDTKLAQKIQQQYFTVKTKTQAYKKQEAKNKKNEAKIPYHVKVVGPDDAAEQMNNVMMFGSSENANLYKQQVQWKRVNKKRKLNKKLKKKWNRKENAM